MSYKIAVVDSNYRDDITGGITHAWLLWELSKRSIVPVGIEVADFILITCSSPQGVDDVRKKLKNKPKHSRVILGGSGALCPAIFDDYIDVACVGEGKNWIDTFLDKGYDAALDLPESWIPGDTKTVIPSIDFPWDLPPIRSVDGINRVFASRGCKGKCLFCQTGWETTYRCNPNTDELHRQISGLLACGEKISVITNDGAENAVSKFYGHEFVSMRLDNLKKLMPIKKKFSKNVRIGVEGVSERLRNAIAKPIASDDLLAVTRDLLLEKIQVRWFFVMGLPGETDKDYDELDYLIKQARGFSWGFAFLHFHPFMPFPATPLCIFPVIDEYLERIEETKRRYYRGTYFTKRIQMLRHLTHYKTRMENSMQNMAASEVEIRRGWWNDDNKNWRVKYLYSPDKLREIASIYARKVGLITP